MRLLPITLFAILGFSLACGAPEDEDDDDDDKPGRDTEDTDTPFDTDTELDCDTWYGDADGDGVGDADTTKVECSQPSGYVAVAGDCDDDDPSVQEYGYWYDDIDGDGYGNEITGEESCHAPAEDSVQDGTDCNDLNAALNPAATEICDSLDNDCDDLVDDLDDNLDTTTGAEWAYDDDGDGFFGTEHTEWWCEPPEGAGPVDAARDCDDTDADVSPDAEEVCDNGVDDDCNETAAPCGVSAGSATDADVKFTGGNSSDQAGLAVAIGDINGDGDDDLLVGAPYAESGSYDVGEVKMYTTNTTGTISESSAWGTVQLGTSSTYDNAYFGYSVAVMGDQNSDGKEDFVVGAYGYSSSKGAAVLYRGAASAPTNSSWSGTGGATSDYCGRDIAGGIDLNGDSTDDFVYGCHGEYAGSVYIIDDNSTYEISDSTTTAGLGRSVAVGDFNGDGRGDVVAGAPDDTDVLLFFGPIVSGSSSTLVDETTSGGSYHGAYVDSVGDVDDDGYDDFVAGSGSYGYAYLYPGAASSIMGGGFSLSKYMYAAVGGDFDDDGVTDLVLGTCDYAYVAFGPVTASPSWETISGTSDSLGCSLAVGDLDDDGVDDLAAGGPDDSDSGSAAGAVFVFFGGGI